MGSRSTQYERGLFHQLMHDLEAIGELAATEYGFTICLHNGAQAHPISVIVTAQGWSNFSDVAYGIPSEATKALIAKLRDAPRDSAYLVHDGAYDFYYSYQPYL